MEQKLYDGKNDAQFERPYVDVDEWREAPVRHRYVHGGFEGTQSRFCFYYPRRDEYKGRFFQKLAPVQGPEDDAQRQEGGEDMISFSVLHGAYYVETNMGGIVNGGGDDTLIYRCSAQSAELSRRLAVEMYGCGRPYGYVFGGSGGGFKTISCAENTIGIWDGAVPFVIGSPVAMPNVFTVRAHAMRLLRHKLPQIVDAIEPGGGDPFEGLTPEEAEALKEATAMGFPLRTWCVYHTIGEGALPVVTPAVNALDPSYYEDFWKLRGYLGTVENGSAVRDRIRMETTISEILTPEGILKGVGDSVDETNAYGVDEAWKNQLNKAIRLPYLRLDEFLQDDPYLKGLKIRFLSGALTGETFSVQWIRDAIITIDNSTDTRDLAVMLEKAHIGDRVLLDNSDYIALQTYHRHQVPGREYGAWDQFRDEHGKPIYPQRPFLVGPIIAQGGAGGVQNGTPKCKMIVLESLMDESAFPWQADWYRREVEKNGAQNVEDSFRLWFMDNCMHTDCEEGNGGDHQHIVSYLGALHQALLDLSDWVERGITPAQTSCYTMDGGQVRLPDSANERKGIQPVVHLYVEGQKCAKVNVGETVVFTAEIQTPDGSGVVEKVCWDFEAADIFTEEGIVTTENDGQKARAVVGHVFKKAGTYFPVVKVASNKTPGDMFTKVMNQDRVRIIVTE